MTASEYMALINDIEKKLVQLHKKKKNLLSAKQNIALIINSLTNCKSVLTSVKDLTLTYKKNNKAEFSEKTGEILNDNFGKANNSAIRISEELDSLLLKLQETIDANNSDLKKYIKYYKQALVLEGNSEV